MKRDLHIDTNNMMLWAILEHYRWDERGTAHNCDDLTREVIKSFGRPLVKTAWKYAEELFYHLRVTVERFETETQTQYGDYGGDDSYGDMLWHVVGKGHEFYHKVLSDPNYLNGMRYQECFSYCSHLFMGED